MKTNTLVVAATVAAQSLLSCGGLSGAEAGGVRDELQAIQHDIQIKLLHGAKTAKALNAEINRLDSLLAEHWDEKTDEVAEVMLAQAALYGETLRDPVVAEAILQRLKFSFSGTAAASQADGMIASYRQQVLGNNTPESREILVEADVKVGFSVGQRFPDFKVSDLNGTPLSVAGFHGKVVLIDFWATWCGPCVAELPNVLDTYRQYHDEGFEIIGVSLDDDRNALEDFLQQRGVPWAQFFDGNGWNNELAQRCRIHSIPATFLLDHDGVIVAKNVRGSALERAVADALSP